MSKKVNFNVLKAGNVDQTLGKKIKEVILTSNTFIVYMDEDEIIQWSTFGHTQWGEDFGHISNQISYWESICNQLFTKNDSYDCKTLLAEAYARMLDEGNDKAAQKIIDQTVERIKIQGKEILRQEYIWGSMITIAVVLIVLLVTVIFKDFIIEYFSNDIYRIFLTGLFGAIGAFVSTMIRVKKYEAELIVGKSAHRLDGFLRIMFGLIAGIVVSLGIKSDILFGFVRNINATDKDFTEIFIGIISGASEVVLPNIIKKVESKI